MKVTSLLRNFSGHTISSRVTYLHVCRFPLRARPTVCTSRPHAPSVHFFSLPIKQASFFISASFSLEELADFGIEESLPFALQWKRST